MHLLILLILILYFWQDQEISPQAEAMRTLTGKVSVEKNGYVYAMGIMVQGDPLTAGTEYVALHDTAIAQRSQTGISTASLPTISSILGSTTNAVSWLGRDSCFLTENLCLKDYQANAPKIRTLRREHIALLQRYAQLKVYPFFQQPLALELDSPILNYKPIVDAARLSLMLIALDVQKLATQQLGLYNLNQESIYWRRVLAQSETFIDKFTAIDMVEQQSRLASEIITAYPKLVKHNATLLATITQPLSKDELSLRLPIHTDFSMLSKWLFLLQAQRRQRNPLLDQLGITSMQYKARTTINRMSDRYSRALLKQSLRGKDIIEQGRILENTLDHQDTTLDWNNPVNWINPLGATIATTATPDYSDQSLRLHDLDSLLRLTEVQRQIALNSPAPASIPNFILELGPTLYDPYTQMPMIWKPDTRSLSAQAHSSKAKDRPVHKVQLQIQQAQ